jgi:hypothetical protein
MARGFLISDGLRQDIKRTIARVDGMPDGPGATKIPTRFETIQQSAPPIRLAAYPRTVSWNQGSTAAVSFYTHTGTAYGLVSTAADGTATALNVCGDFITLPNGDPSEKVGPTPTMTWCIVSKSRGGANVAVEGPQADTTLAAYRVSDGEWQKGERREIGFYAVVNGQIVATGKTATAGNVSQTYYPLSTATQGTASGPTPTMAWCVVSKNVDGNLIVAEAENAPTTRFGARTQFGDKDEPWNRGSTRYVRLTGTTTEVEVTNVFETLSHLDLRNGVAVTKTLDPNGSGETAYAVISPSAIPLHVAAATSSGNWNKGEQKTLTVLPADGRTGSLTQYVTNKFYEDLEVESGEPLAIGKFGTAYHVISAPPGSSVKLGVRTNFGDDETPWNRGSVRYVRLTGSTTEVEVTNVFETLTHLDLRNGVAITKTVDPNGGEGTTYSLISPASIPLHVARPQQDGNWAKGAAKDVNVLPADGRTSQEVATVTNKFYEDFDAETGVDLAIGKFGTAYHVVSAPQVPSIKLGSRTSFGDKDQPWGRGSTRYVRLAGSTAVVEVVNVFETLSHLDLRNGVAVAKTIDPNTGEGTAYSLISPASIPLHVGQMTSDSAWAKGASKDVTILPADGRTASLTQSVTNKFFDTAEVVANQPMAVGRFGTEYVLLTGGSSDSAKMAERTGSGQWEYRSQQGIRLQGSTTDVQAYNAVGHYEGFDGQSSGGVPGLAVVKGKDFGGSTAWYVVSPPPVRFLTGTFSGAWGIGQSKSALIDNLGVSVDAINNFFPVTSTTSGKSCAIAKRDSQWYLVDVRMNTATAVFIQNTSSATFLSTGSTFRVTALSEGATQTISYISGITVNTSSITVVTGVSASLNTANCTISVTSATSTASVVTSVNQQTGSATVISTDGTRTALSVSLSGTQTVTIVGSTFTAAFLRIE